MRMQSDNESVLLVSMPFAETSIPSIQLALLEAYLKQRDIKVNSKHLYLKAAEFYGLENYNFLINSPNDSYAAQIVFSKYLFPDFWEKTKNNFLNFYNNVLLYDKNFSNSLNFEKYIKQTDNFYNWICKQYIWKSYDIIGFTLNYGQFLPSLATAKFIKTTYPNKKIVFGGSTTIDKLGIQVLKAFNFIDYIISGDGEDALALLANNINLESIPGLIYRKNNEIFKNDNNDLIDLNQLPIPDFISFYDELNDISAEIQQYYYLYGRIPIELSRGCWWNNCTFCNMRVYHKKYREKNIKYFIKELKVLSETYQMLTFQIIGSTLPKDNYKELCKQLIELGKDFNFYVEARAGQLKSEDYNLLKKAGFNNIQTGIETFSSNYLKKINKGVKVIDNIAALKFCKENDIKNTYNLIVDYPNEDYVDFEQTKKNIRYIQEYLDPPQISKLYVGFGSSIYNHQNKYNIKNLDFKTVDKLMYPQDILSYNFCFFNKYQTYDKKVKNDWVQLVDNWKKTREKFELIGLNRKTIIDRLVFFYIDGGNFLKIYDKRNPSNVQISILDEAERRVFLSCEDVISFQEIQDKFSNIPDYQLAAILHSFEQAGIVFREDDYYFSLPLNYRMCFGIKKETQLERDDNIFEEKVTI